MQAQPPITVDQAIRKGHHWVNWPAMGIMLLTFLGAFVLAFASLWPWWMIPGSFFLAAVLSWLWWSFMITRWRLWAFSRVRNVHELHERAVMERLLWRSGSVFERTEIRSAADRAQWQELLKKFEVADAFEDDLAVPAEIRIYHSKIGHFIELCSMLFVLGFGLYLMLSIDNVLPGVGIAALGAFLSYQSFRRLADRSPQIVLNDRGIQTASAPFCAWSQIEGEAVTSSWGGRTLQHQLVYVHQNGYVNLPIDGLDVGAVELGKWLRIYRGRYERAQT